MTNKQPPFEINERIMADVIEIAELVGRVSVTDKISMNPTLRRTNRIQTIYSSLAIEQNTLDLEQVTAVLSGKRVIAPPKDIAEVQNAYEIYDNMDKLNPYSIDDILKAHSVMERGLLNEAENFVHVLSEWLTVRVIYFISELCHNMYLSLFKNYLNGRKKVKFIY